MFSKQEGKVVTRGYFEVTSLLAADPRSLSHRNEIKGSATHDQMVHKKTTNKAVENFKKVLCQSVCNVPNHSPTVLTRYAALISLMFRFFEWKCREYRKSTQVFNSHFLRRWQSRSKANRGGNYKP